MNSLHNLARGLQRLLTTPEEKASLSSVLTSPEVRALMDREDQAQRDERAALLAELAAAPQRHADAQAQALKDAKAAGVRLATAEAELLAARQADAAAQIAKFSVDAVSERETAQLLAKLQATADPRLAHLLTHLARVTDLVRARFTMQMQPQPIKGTDRFKPTMATNRDAILAAEAAIGRVCEAARQMQLEALLTAEVTSRLQPLLTEMHKALSAVEVRSQIELDASGLLTVAG